MSAIEWTEAHRREALRRCYELAAETRATLLADTLARAALGACRGDLGRFSALLSTVGYDAARIERELRRVDALATGRLVRETVWRRIDGDGDRAVIEEHTERPAPDVACGTTVVRVTRIRRAQ